MSGVIAKAGRMAEEDIRAIRVAMANRMMIVGWWVLILVVFGECKLCT